MLNIDYNILFMAWQLTFLAVRPEVDQDKAFASSPQVISNWQNPLMLAVSQIVFSND